MRRFVLYKEKNMLLTERQLSRRRQIRYPQPERLKKVQKSMGAIRQVLGERKREKIAAAGAKKAQAEAAEAANGENEAMDVDVEGQELKQSS